ncbi:MTRF1L release factor glutamine methyltransferase isoform X2 [Lethenteron reissneri]|uniref:MTRF1L release factor glutamine methyltransferase isoform X2 n=1 Tax=Lethenteron reissneri TaxID=7753 RepID=UPI002AB6F4EA|nr:MTRF1L release factor glutamine methyltransferase isoform X2 [Lethenteron reissneri]
MPSRLGQSTITPRWHLAAPVAVTSFASAALRLLTWPQKCTQHGTSAVVTSPPLRAEKLPDHQTRKLNWHLKFCNTHELSPTPPPRTMKRIVKPIRTWISIAPRTLQGAAPCPGWHRPSLNNLNLRRSFPDGPSVISLAAGSIESTGSGTPFQRPCQERSLDGLWCQGRTAARQRSAARSRTSGHGSLTGPRWPSPPRDFSTWIWSPRAGRPVPPIESEMTRARSATAPRARGASGAGAAEGAGGDDGDGLVGRGEDVGGCGRRETALGCVRSWSRRFRAAGISEPWESAAYIVAHVLGAKTMASLGRAVLTRSIAAEAQAKVGELCRRRLTSMPVQYVLGQWDFMDLTLKMRPPVLIPRPETEELVSAVLGSSLVAAGDQGGPSRVLDIGCGSGAISLAILSASPLASCVAVDKSADAVALARENAEDLSLQDRCSVMQLNITAAHAAEALGALGPFDVLVSNPPYVFTGDMAALQPEIRSFEDPAALHGGEDGMDLIKVVLTLAAEVVKDNGPRFCVLRRKARAGGRLSGATHV